MVLTLLLISPIASNNHHNHLIPSNPAILGNHPINQIPRSSRITNHIPIKHLHHKNHQRPGDDFAPNHAAFNGESAVELSFSLWLPVAFVELSSMLCPHIHKQ